MSEQPEELIRAALKDGCRAHCDSLIHELRRLHPLNRELLEALKQALEECIWPNERLSDVYDKARAAIARAEEKA
jgi:hypothetical protein